MNKKLLRSVLLFILTIVPAVALLFYYRASGEAIADQFGMLAFPVLGVLTMVLVYGLYKLIERAAGLPTISIGSLIIILLLTIGSASNMQLFKQIGIWLEPPQYVVGTASYLNSFVTVTKYELKETTRTQPTTPIMLNLALSQENKGEENHQFQLSVYFASRKNMVTKKNMNIYDAQVNVEIGKSTHKGDVGVSTNTIVCTLETVTDKDDLAVLYQYNYAGSATELVISDETRDWLWNKLQELHKTYPEGLRCIE
jgi:hypothetical protein